jgi:hypothetical protein
MTEEKIAAYLKYAAEEQIGYTKISKMEFNQYKNKIVIECEGKIFLVEVRDMT